MARASPSRPSRRSARCLALPSSPRTACGGVRGVQCSVISVISSQAYLLKGPQLPSAFFAARRIHFGTARAPVWQPRTIALEPIMTLPSLRLWPCFTVRSAPACRSRPALRPCASSPLAHWSRPPGIRAPGSAATWGAVPAGLKTAQLNILPKMQFRC